MLTSTTIEDRRMEERDEERREQRHQNPAIGMATSPLAPITNTSEVPPEPILPGKKPPAFSSDADSLADAPSDPLPNYTRQPDDPPSASFSRLPSYAKATGRKPTIQELIPDEEERLASLLAFAEEKQYANDYFGGQKGRAEGPPNDPFKLFRWAKRKASGEGPGTWRRMSVEQRAKWEEDGGLADDSKGEVGPGDVDTHLIA